MCGRFSIERGEDIITHRFHIENENVRANLTPKYNIAPTDSVPIVFEKREQRIIEDMTWGLVPSWAENPSIGHNLINARVEGIQTKNSFRSAFIRRRCIIPASGFYEWRKEGNQKFPYYVKLDNEEMFGMAGMYEYWKKPDDTFLLSFSIITTEPNTYLKNLHDRMPAILNPDHEALWLSENTPTTDLIDFLKPYTYQELKAFQVPKLVNSPVNKVVDVVNPIKDASGNRIYLPISPTHQSALDDFF